MFEFLAFTCINFLGMISPGPDFAIVSRYGILGSRKAAILASLGITTALFIHVSYCLLGVAVFLKGSPFLLHTIQTLGACYLGYLGIKMILERKTTIEHEEALSSLHKKAFLRGFLTNLLNPKATFFLLSLFTQFVSNTTPFYLKAAYAATIPLSALGWFCFLAYALTHPSVYTKIKHYQKTFTLVMGLLLICLACYVFLTVFVLS